MTKQELQTRIDKLQKAEIEYETKVSNHKIDLEYYQEALDEATLELSKLELQLAKIEEQEDEIDYDDDSTDQEANDRITHSASEPR